MNYKEQVEAHIDQYITEYLSHLKRHYKHKHVLSEENNILDTFLPHNQAPYLKYKNEIGKLHSPYNLKSSQLFCLDLFLPYKENPNKLKEILNLKEDIISLEFEKVFDDYTHVDVFLKTSTNKKVLIEFKYTEEKFDIIRHIKPRHNYKWEAMYKNINKHFKTSVTKIEFFENYQLYRNLYNSLNSEFGEQGYMYVCFSQKNSDLVDQFNNFIEKIKTQGLLGITPKWILVEDLNLTEEYSRKYKL